jgi:uncharacterized protein YqjF (DUF2071 family)
VEAGTSQLDGFDLIQAPARQSATLGETRHRPWPLPERAWLMGQTWHDLLFAHWAVEAEQLEALLPPGLALDRFEGQAYLGLTPFRLSGLRIRGTLPLPRLSSFLELNVRTYVTAGGKPGIWFFSLDAASRLAVEAARRLYHLPYFRAAMSATERGGWLDYACARMGAERPYVFEGRYAPLGAARPAQPGTLEAFLTERYCLYAVDGPGRLHRADIHHPPWPLQRAEARIDLNTMPPNGVRLPVDEPLLHFSRRQDVLIWPLARVD